MVLLGLCMMLMSHWICMSIVTCKELIWHQHVITAVLWCFPIGSERDVVLI